MSGTKTPTKEGAAAARGRAAAPASGAAEGPNDRPRTTAVGTAPESAPVMGRRAPDAAPQVSPSRARTGKDGGPGASDAVAGPPVAPQTPAAGQEGDTSLPAAGFHGVLLPALTPGSPEWMTRMTASKVAAVLGLSPWESRFSLWHRMAGLIDAQPDTDVTRRGHYLEDAVATWWADQHPELIVGAGYAWAHPERGWQAASPDRLCYAGPVRDDQAGPVALLEVKTTADSDEWGPAGTDEIPPYYRAQVVWQLDTLGLAVGHVAVLLPRLEFREYRIEYNAEEAAYIRDEAEAFLDTLPGGPAEQRPDLDAHTATYTAVRILHPDIDGTDVDVPHWLARDYCTAVTELRAATRAHDFYRTTLADHMQTAKRARFDGVTIADRRAKNGGTPYLQAATRLPDIPQEVTE